MHSFSSDPVDVGCLHRSLTDAAAIKRNVIPTQVVGQDDYDVRWAIKIGIPLISRLVPVNG